MRHNSNYNNLTNNNNSNNSNNSQSHSHGLEAAAAARFCSIDNAFKYYGPMPWSQSNSPSKSNPSKDGGGGVGSAVRQINRTSYQTAANSASDSAHYTDAILKSYSQRHEPRPTSWAPTTVNAASGYTLSHVHPHSQRPAAGDYYNSFRQYKTRQYGAASEPNRSVRPDDAPKYVQAPTTPLEQEKLKWSKQARARARLQLDNGSSAYTTYNSSPSPEPTWDTILSERPSHSTDQHYEHYFSYFYNRGPEHLKTASTPIHTASRKLPATTMSKHESRSADTKTTKTFVRRDVSNDSNRNQYEHFILKEKLPNNNLPLRDNDDDWTDDGGDYHDGADAVFIKAGEDFYDNDEVDQSAQHRQHRRRNEQNRQEGGDATTANNNNNELRTKPTKEALSAPRLPLTPKKVRGATPKKLLPTVHRVLLYNSQSPRLPRKQQSAVLRTQYAKQQQTYKSPAGENEVPMPTVILVDADDQPADNNNPAHFERDDDYDDDDDLDDVSNFDESDTASVSSDTEDGYRAHAYKLTHSMDRFFSTRQSTPSLQSQSQSTTISLSQSSEDDLKNPDSLLVPSLFPYVPPYLSFSSNTKKGPKVPPELHRVLKWRITNIMPKVVRLILANSGMRMLKKTNDWMGVWGKHLKSPCFKTIRSYQKINHLPGSFRIGRKDSCWKNLQRQMNRHSNREFGFMPRTYIIPNDLCALRKTWPKYAQRNTKWIIKPPASARGAGIRVINRWGQIPKRRPLIVQKYIERPLLINGSKFDLRLYVLVTSVNPLRVFLYHNGLARFASVKYSSKADTLNDRCMHLTNYSINKFSSNYSKNEDVNACHGHKWTIKSLFTYLANRGVRTDCLWEALRGLVLRTILAGENGINSMIRANVESKYSCFELFGFDVLLDADLVPWLLEVNISPSLHSELPLDAHVKAPLVQGVLNTALYNVPPKLTMEKQKELAAEFSFPPGTQMCYDKRLYINYLSREEKVKHNTFTRKSMEQREEYVDAILEKLTPDDVRCLIVAEDELARCAPLERIFPTDQTHKYLKYNDSPRYYNRLLDAWESRYANNRTEGIALLRDFCQTKYHLQVPSPPAKKVSNASAEEDPTKAPLSARGEDSNA